MVRLIIGHNLYHLSTLFMTCALYTMPRDDPMRSWTLAIRELRLYGLREFAKNAKTTS